MGIYRTSFFAFLWLCIWLKHVFVFSQEVKTLTEISVSFLYQSALSASRDTYGTTQSEHILPISKATSLPFPQAQTLSTALLRATQPYHQESYFATNVERMTQKRCPEHDGSQSGEFAQSLRSPTILGFNAKITQFGMMSSFF